jgi:hypothetical protein
VAPLVQIYTAAAANAETEASACLAAGESYNTGYGSGASGHGVGHVSSGTGASPPTAPSSLGDTVAQRLERILGYGSMSLPMRAIDPASNLVQAALDVGGQQTGANVANIQGSDSGWWFYDLCNVANYRQRSHLNADSVAWNIGMNVTAGYIPFQGDIKYDNDKMRAYAAISVNPYSPDGATLAELVPANYVAVNAAQQQYGPGPLSVNSYLQSTSEQQSQVNWLFSYYGTIRKRVAALTIDAAGHPEAWGIVAGLNIGDIVRIFDQPMGGPPTTAIYRVSSMDRALAFAANGQGVMARITIVADPVLTFWS